MMPPSTLWTGRDVARAGRRQEHDHRRDVFGVVDALQRDASPVWLPGTSHGYFFRERRPRKEEGANSGGLRIKLSIEHHRTMAWFGVSKRRSRCIIWSFILDVMGFLMPSQGL